MPQKILLLGDTGQLGQCFLNCNDNRFNIIGINRSHFDLLDYTKLKECITHHKPDVIINCIAYTNVDNAEVDNRNLIANGVLVSHLAEISQGSRLVQFSTDYVFNGAIREPNELARPAPVNQYGVVKLYADNHIMHTLSDYLIFRISTLYSKYNNNIVKTFASLLKTGQKLTAVADACMVPTDGQKLAHDVLNCLDLPSGLYNYAGQLDVTPYNIANIIRDELYNLGYKNLGSIEPTVFSDYIKTRKANRPKTIILNSNKLRKLKSINQCIYTDIPELLKELKKENK